MFFGVEIEVGIKFMRPNCSEADRYLSSRFGPRPISGDLLGRSNAWLQISSTRLLQLCDRVCRHKATTGFGLFSCYTLSWFTVSLCFPSGLCSLDLSNFFSKTLCLSYEREKYMIHRLLGLSQRSDRNDDVLYIRSPILYTAIQRMHKNRTIRRL